MRSRAFCSVFASVWFILSILASCRLLTGPSLLSSSSLLQEEDSSITTTSWKCSGTMLTFSVRQDLLRRKFKFSDPNQDGGVSRDLYDLSPNYVFWIVWNEPSRSFSSLAKSSADLGWSKLLICLILRIYAS